MESKVYSDDLRKFLIRKFEEFLTEERLRFIENVLANRTEYIRVILENVRDPHNSNALIRTGECLGIQHFHIIENENKFKLGKRSSKGAIKWIDVHQHEALESPNRTVINDLKSKGYKIAVCAPAYKSLSVHELPLDTPTAILLGNERDGCSDIALELADYKISIPMYGFTESYNVSVAGAIVMNTLINRLRASDINWTLDTLKKEKLRFDWYKKSLNRPEDYEDYFCKLYEQLNS